MELTIIETGKIPETLRDRFTGYPEMIEDMFKALEDDRFSFRIVRMRDGEELPRAADCEAIVITGSSAGVYEDHDWIAPLEQFVRDAFAAHVPMAGICFGHQIIAQAMGGRVVNSERGWGLGRHSYRRIEHEDVLPGDDTIAVLCLHQDQVIEKPDNAEVFLESDFTPNAGLVYRDGPAITVQPHPEFADDYALALIDMRRDRISEEIILHAEASLERDSDSPRLARAIADFLLEAEKQRRAA